MLIDIPHLLSPDGAIARRLDGFESRPQQAEMAALVTQALADRGRLLVEAGTGVGKSFAYLMPAIKRILENEERVIIATNTIALQEQLIEKDIPLLNAIIPDEFTAVLVKGRGNYVSLRRLKLASERQEKLFSSDDRRHTLHQIEDWAYTTTDGTRSTLPPLQHPDVWDFAQSDAHNCMGRKCPTYEQCFFQAARRRMENGDLLVCNHALFFSDLALRAHGVGFLPPYDHVILDEAHAIEDVAAEHFGLSLSESRVRHLVSLLYQARTGRGFLATLRLKDGSTTRVDEAIQVTLDVEHAMRSQFDRLEAWQREVGRPNGRIDTPDVVPNVLGDALKRLGDRLRLLRDRASSDADEYELNSYSQRASDLASELEILLGQQIDGCVYWVEGADPELRRGQPGRYGRSRRIALRCMTVDVGPTLRERLWGKDMGVVLTSATLTTAPDDFTHIAGRLGCEDAVTSQLGSPFEHGRQMRVLVDQSMPDPKSADYVDQLVPRLFDLIARTDGGAWVLFTSFAMLKRADDAIRSRLEEDGHPVFAQGRDGPPGLLVRRFKRDRRSVLLGTSSFWQGVDVRGEGLRNVIITRLPFDVPDRPLIEARHERIEEAGGHPFMQDQVPRAIIRFRQGIGRLIRSTSDRGIVAVLDPRVVTKAYGRLFLKALPDGVEPEPMWPDGPPHDDSGTFDAPALWD